MVNVIYDFDVCNRMRSNRELDICFTERYVLLTTPYRNARDENGTTTN